MDNAEKLHIELNLIYKAQDDIYHNYADFCGVSASAFWVLYALYEARGDLCQSDLCAQWKYTKQTVNTAVSGLVKKGYIQLEKLEGTKKALKLTPEGVTFCHKYVKPLYKAEIESLNCLTDEEKVFLRNIFKKQCDTLKTQIDKITKGVN